VDEAATRIREEVDADANIMATTKSTPWENSMKKAYTAKAQRRPSGEFATAVKDNFTAGALRPAPARCC
jgi:uncharacterized protein GlcG (DUF336 family)